MQPDTGVTFGDVVGVDGAKLELEEVVQFLKESDRFTAVGARIPRGLILEVFLYLVTLQHTATHCNTLQHTATQRISDCTNPARPHPRGLSF